MFKELSIIIICIVLYFITRLYNKTNSPNFAFAQPVKSNPTPSISCPPPGQHRAVISPICEPGKPCPAVGRIWGCVPDAPHQT